MTAEIGWQDLKRRVGEDLGTSEWFGVDQERVDRFADVTLDHQFVHVDPERALKTPFGGTIAHGLLTLSLIVHLCLPFVPKLERQTNPGARQARRRVRAPCGSNHRPYRRHDRDRERRQAGARRGVVELARRRLSVGSAFRSRN
jgi:hypothetical protein